MSLSSLMQSLGNAIRRLFGGGDGSSTKGVKLLECPNSKEERATMEIGREGGTLRLGEHRLEVTPGAVTQPVKFTAALLVDRVLKLQIQANGEDGFKFEQPASLTLSYAACGGSAAGTTLQVYKIDPKTNEVIEALGGKVDERARSVTASLRTLSVYTLGSPT